MRIGGLVFLLGLVALTISVFVYPRNGHEQDVDDLLARIADLHGLSPLKTREVDIGPKFLLGRALFFDPILSGPRDVACSTCHLMDRATTDALPMSIGTGAVGLGESRKFLDSAKNQMQPRNGLDLFNRDHNHVRALFWDGRVEALSPNTGKFRSPMGELLPDGLENLMAVQAIFPLVRSDEMLGIVGSKSSANLPADHANLENEFASKSAHLEGAERASKIHTLIMTRLLGTDANQAEWQIKYRRLFEEAFPYVDESEYTIVHVGNAIARFEEIAFATRRTAWDEYLRGNTNAISENAKRGAILFYGKAGCVACHQGPLLSDFMYHSIGVQGFNPGVDGTGHDLGRYNVTGSEADKYKFRTPPLRNVSNTAPYFHNGSVPTLEKAIVQHLNPLERADSYNADGSFAMTVEQIESVSPLLLSNRHLTEPEVELIIDFLESLSDTSQLTKDFIVPENVPSGLKVQAYANN